MIRLQKTPGYDPQRAGDFRSQRCCRWVQRRADEARVHLINVAREARLTPRELHELEEGRLTTDEDGWQQLDAALLRLLGRAA